MRAHTHHAPCSPPLPLPCIVLSGVVRVSTDLPICAVTCFGARGAFCACSARGARGAPGAFRARGALGARVALGASGAPGTLGHLGHLVRAAKPGRVVHRVWRTWRLYWSPMAVQWMANSTCYECQVLLLCFCGGRTGGSERGSLRRPSWELDPPPPMNTSSLFEWPPNITDAGIPPPSRTENNAKFTWR